MEVERKAGGKGVAGREEEERRKGEGREGVGRNKRIKKNGIRKKKE